MKISNRRTRRCVGLWLCLLCSGVGSVQAASVMRWQDTQGQWHFSDPGTAPPAAQPVQPSRNGNFVKSRVVRIPPVSQPKRSRAVLQTAPSRRLSPGVEAQQRRQRCEDWSERLRFKAFNNDERLSYEHECVAGVRW